MFQTPVPAAQVVPALGVADTNARLAGRRSLTWTPVALFGPRSVAAMVNVTLAPTAGVGLLTDFRTRMSAAAATKNLPTPG